jgi:DNA modification methylase
MIFHGDCRDVTEWLEADVLLTDPPYGMSFNSGWQSRPINNDQNTDARDMALELWGGRPALVFGRWDQPHPQNTKVCLTWDKGNWPGMGDLSLPWGPSTEEIYVLGDGFVGKRGGSVIRRDRLTGNTTLPNEKPVGLLIKLLQHCPEGTIADPFMGSGTTLRAAKNLGRQAIGVESDERYCEVAAKRLSQGAFDFESV